MPVRNYHRMFTRIHTGALQSVRDVVDRGLWRVEEDEGFNLIRDLYRSLSGVYDMPVPSLIRDNHEYYLIPSERIGLPRVSLVSCLHEYRHHMQKHSRQHYSDVEVDARGWSISTFHMALPQDFDSAWERGLIWFMPPHPD